LDSLAQRLKRCLRIDNLRAQPLALRSCHLGEGAKKGRLPRPGPAEEQQSRQRFLGLAHSRHGFAGRRTFMPACSAQRSNWLTAG